jgi:pimeloyl-ACP methyl ester carboxylesterase
MVLVEAGADDPRRLFPDGKLGRSSDLATGRPIPAVKISNPLRISDIPPSALSQMRAGAQEDAKHPNDPPRDKLPADAQRMRAWTLAQLGHVAAAVNQFENEELAGLRAERTKSKYPLGDMPLIVLTRGIPEEKGPDGKAFEEEHRRDHAAIAAMSRKGQLVIASHSGHHVQIDEPELVIKSIREVVLESVRK